MSDSAPPLAPTARKSLGNFWWLLIERGVRTGVALLVSIYVTRYLGAEKIGLLGYAQSLVFLLTWLSTLGFDQILVRELVRFPEQRDRLLGTTFWLRVFGALVSALLLVGYTAVSGLGRSLSVLVWILCTAAFFDATGVVDRFFESRVEARKPGRFRLVAFFVSSGVRLLLVVFEADLAYFAASFVLNSVLQAAGYLLAYGRQKLRTSRWRFDFGLARHLLRTSWPVMVGALALQVQVRIDQVMLASLLGAEPMGHYAVAIRLIELLAVVSTAITSSLGPVVMAAKERGIASFEQAIVQLYRVLFASAMAIGIPVFLLGEWTVVLMYGEAFQLAGALFALLSFRLLLAHLGMGREVFVVNESLFRFSLWVMLAASCVNVVGNSLLIPRFGPHGAFYASMVSLGSIFFLDAMHPQARRNLLLLFGGVLTSWKLGFVVGKLRR